MQLCQTGNTFSVANMNSEAKQGKRSILLATLSGDHRERGFMYIGEGHEISANSGTLTAVIGALKLPPNEDVESRITALWW